VSVEVVTATQRGSHPGNDLLGAYVPAVVADWLGDRPDQNHRSITGTLMFADVSGFTRMTEMLAVLGKLGAEEMAELINGTFEKLLAPAFAYGADLIKWGGDASLLLFQGPGHVERAVRAAQEMRAVMRREGSLRTSRGSVRLQMSVGIHTGVADYMLVGEDRHRELLVVGRVVTLLKDLERAAGPGQIVVSRAVAKALEAAGTRPLRTEVDPGLLLRSRAVAAVAGRTEPVNGEHASVDLGVTVCETLRDHISAGGLDGEHRHVTTCFIRYSGVDQLLARAGLADATAALDYVIQAAQQAAASNRVTFLATDIAADGVVVMFGSGAPRSFGQDEDRMIATARAIIDAGGELPIHVGISSGKTFAGDYGPPYRRTYSMMGDSVNTAARLSAHAAEGELLVTESTLDGSTGSLQTTARAPFAVKGKRAAVRTFAVGRPTALRAAEDSTGSRLVGREPELAKLLGAEQALRSGAGGAVELLGPPGIGKTRLLGELTESAKVPVLRAHGDIYASARPYAPFEPLLRAQLSLDPQESTQTMTARLGALVRRQAPQLMPFLPLLGIVAGLELPSTPEVEEIDPTQRKQRLEELAGELLAAVITEPSILAFDDAHLMDDASLDLIARLAGEARERPWLVIVSRRPHGSAPLEGVADQVIELGPLGDAATQEFLALATDASPVPPHKLSALAGRAAGNPLFLRELVSQVAGGGDPDTLPKSVEGAIAARIDRLPRADRRTLCSAAVLGLDVEEATLQEVLAAEAGTSVPAVRLAALSGFLHPVSPGCWRFSQQLVREVAYESLPYRRRRSLHALTAAAIERAGGGEDDQQAELLSLHCNHAGLYEQAWRYSRIAARSAQGRYANAEAAEAYRRALGAAARLGGLDAADTSEVEEALGDIYVELGELQAADVALRRALAGVRAKPISAARLQLKISRLREISGSHVAALRWVQRAKRTLDDTSDEQAGVIRAQLATRRARIKYRQARYGEALASAEDAIALARESSDDATLAEALEYADAASMELGSPAGDRAEEALAIYQHLGDLGAEARVRNTLGALAYHAGRWSEALAQYGLAERAYTRCGRPWAATISLANSAEILVDQDRLEEARDALERAMRVWRGVDASTNIAFGEYQLARVEARGGSPEAAMDHLEAARSRFRAAGELTEVVVVDALMAECLGLAGRDAEALALADATLTRARALGGVASATPLLQRVRAAALLSLGRREEAVGALYAGLTAARSRGAAHEIAFTVKAILGAEATEDREDEAALRDELAALSTNLGIAASA
jgi:class 3 adenylate cyclase/tetratricopeptide (TPR) repeat protein